MSVYCLSVTLKAYYKYINEKNFIFLPHIIEHQTDFYDALFNCVGWKKRKETDKQS